MTAMSDISTNERPLILNILSPAIETSTEDRVYPVPDKWLDEFRLKYPTLKPLDKKRKGPNMYRCEKCHSELGIREGSKQLHFYHIPGSNRSGCPSEKQTKDDDIKDENGNWINESPTHRTAKQLLCTMLDERRQILIKGARCSVKGCLNCMPDFTLDYQEGDMVHEEYTLDDGTGRPDVVLVNSGQIRHIFEIYYKHRSNDRPNHSWFEFRAIDVISQFENHNRSIIFHDIKLYDCKNHRFEARPIELMITEPQCERFDHGNPQRKQFQHERLEQFRLQREQREQFQREQLQREQLQREQLQREQLQRKRRAHFQRSKSNIDHDLVGKVKLQALSYCVEDRQREEAEMQRQREEAETRRLKQEADDRRRREEAETRRLKQEADDRRRREEAETRRLKQEADDWHRREAAEKARRESADRAETMRQQTNHHGERQNNQRKLSEDIERAIIIRRAREEYPFLQEWSDGATFQFYNDRKKR